MTTPNTDSILTDVAAGFGELMGAAGVGTWSPDSPFDLTDTALIVGAIPQEQASAVGLIADYVSSDRHAGVGVLSLQCYFRSQDPLTLALLRGKVFNFLDHKAYSVAGGHIIPLIWWRSGADLGGTNGRDFEASDNYYMHFSQAER